MNPKRMTVLLTPLIVSLLLMLVPHSQIAFFYASLIITSVTMFRWKKHILHPGKIDLSTFFATSIYSAYIFTALIVQINLFLSGLGHAAEVFHYNQFYLSSALAVVVAACFFLDVYGMAKPIYLKVNKRTILESSREITFFLIASFLLIAYCFITGSIGLQGNIFTTQNNFEISPLASIALFLIPLTGAMALFLASAGHITSQPKKLALYTCSIIALLLLFTQGRRLVIFLGVLYFISYSLSTSQKIFTIKNFFLAAGVSVIVYLGYQFFFALRIASYSSASSSLFELIPGAFEILLNPAMYDFYSLVSENALERPFIIGYLAKLIELTNLSDFFWGESLLNNFRMNIPSIIVGMKDFPVDEQLIHPRIGLPVIDQPNSIITGGLADFGVVGAIFYPAAYMITVRLFIRLSCSLTQSWLLFFLWLAFLYTLMSVEASITTYISIFRSVIIIMFLCFFASGLSRIITKAPRKQM